MSLRSLRDIAKRKGREVEEGEEGIINAAETSPYRDRSITADNWPYTMRRANNGKPRKKSDHRRELTEDSQ